MKNAPLFLALKTFLPSLKALMQKGGAYQKAGKTVEAAWGRANTGGEYTYDDVFAGIPRTNHGENRIAHCVKFDLTAYARLVTAYSNDICIFLFAGDHASVDTWLDRNKGLNFIAREQGNAIRIDPVFVSDLSNGQHGLIQTDTDWMSNGPVIELLNERYRNKLLVALEDDVINDIRAIESHTDEDKILETVERIPNSEQRDAILDVLLALRASDRVKAKNRIDLFEKSAKPVAALSREETIQVVSGENTIRVQDIDPVLFEHFVKTADFKDWMLYLHPAQREIVTRDFNGPARLAGVSGSGKTCVVIHRALRLARVSPQSKVLILTLNDALARLIDELINAESGEARPKNIVVQSVFELCSARLIQLVPNKSTYFGKTTVANNGFAISEHIDDIWDEFFQCQNNNSDAEAMFDVARTLLVRSVYPQDYLRQEFDFIRSAFAPTERKSYLDMERVGRVIPLERRYREMILKGLTGWEAKMDAVGAIDDNGIVTALYGLLHKLSPEYDHVLVDEVQDLGTLELKIIRRIARLGKNDLFLSGDAAQTVHTKHTDLRSAEIDLPSARWIRINQNYRNSRQILTAAQMVLTRSFENIPPGTIDLEIISPEYANFSSAKPLVLSAVSVQKQISFALKYAKNALASGENRKACIALCGYSQTSVEELAQRLGLPALCGSTDLSSGALFLSDLEQTKGFEFDLVVILNCSDHVIPHPELPEHESFRDLCKLYVALTRAKTELVVSFSEKVSRFISVAEEECFNVGTWGEHVEVVEELSISLPPPALRRVGNTADWSVPGRAFLRLREAVGLGQIVHEEILSHVTGQVKTQGGSSSGTRKQIEWKDFTSFYSDMASPSKRNLIISDQVWNELQGKLGPLVASYEPSQSEADRITTPDLAEKTSIAIDSQPVLESAGRRVTLHRREGILDFSTPELSAHTLAALVVIQDAHAVNELEIGRPMSLKALEFLVPRQILTDWRSKKRLREVHNNSHALALTKAGLDEATRRIKLWEDAANRSATSVAVSGPRINKAIEAIRAGEESNPKEKFVRGNYKL